MTAAEGPPRASIVSPVSRLLGSTDFTRTIAFYCDVLGFDVEEPVDGSGAVAVVSGQAHIRFGAHDYQPDDWEGPRAAGSAVVFFQTENVAALHAAVLQRGGKPSELQKVNWIKMEMFEIRDPDGHALWFGQSYHADSAPRPQGMMRTIMPEMPLDDVQAGIAYYRDVLGFTVNYAQHDIGVMDRDEVRLLLVARTEQHTGIGSAYVYVRDADGLFSELRDRGTNLQGEPISQPWGLREFGVLDLEGNRITFGQPFE